MNETPPLPPSLPNPTLVFKGPSHSKFTHNLSFSLSHTTLTSARHLYQEIHKSGTNTADNHERATLEVRAEAEARAGGALDAAAPLLCKTSKGMRNFYVLFCVHLMDCLQVWEGGREGGSGRERLPVGLDFDVLFLILA